jgi:hypothetical protein
MRLASTRLTCCSLIALVACGDSSGNAEDNTLGTSNLTTNGPISESVEASAEGSGETSGTNPTGDNETTAAPTTTGGEPEWEPIPARGGIEIDWVEANQGIGVKIGAEGTGVGGADRSSYLLRNRLTLVRAFWKPLPDDWEPRKIEGRLIISTPGQEDTVLKSRPMIDGDSFIGNLDRSFYWGLMPEQTVPNIKYRIELWEVGPGAEDLPEPATPPRLPVDGSEAFVGIEASDQVLKITLVPFNYDDGANCKTSPDTSEATMKVFTDYMYMMNPIDRLDFTIHAPIDWNQPLSDFNELNQFMSGLRADEGAEPERYYYGLVDVCSGGLGGAGGKAYGIPEGASKGSAWQRVSSGLSADLEWSAETFVHEVGHSQTRYHVYCNGEEGGPDFSYPHMNGEIGEWGFGVVNFNLYHPTVHRDYMTYCHPVWASTWGWNKVYPIIKELSSWDNAGQPAPDDDAAIGSLLVGSIWPNGREDWITVPGSARPEQLSGVHGVEFVVDGEVVHRPGAWLPQPDGDIVNIAVPLPDRWDEVSAITRVAGPKRVAVDKARVSQHHRPRDLKAAHGPARGRALTRPAA